MIAYPHIDPVALRLGSLEIHWYGLMYLIGFVAAWILGRRRAKQPRSPWTPGQFEDCLTWCILGVVLGGRIGYMVFYNPTYFWNHPADILAIWKGGMSFHGGLMGVILCLYIMARRTGLPFFQVTDLAAPLVPPGLLAGRLGNFINAELWGRPTSVPWAMIFPDREAGPFPRHPSQLYEAALEGVALFCILWWFSAKPRAAGTVSGLFLIFYGLFRFTVEFAREPDSQLGFIALGWVTMGQILCLPMILGGIVLFVWARRRNLMVPSRPQDA